MKMVGELAGLDDFFEAAPSDLDLARLPSDVTIVFALSGDGGGVWTLTRRGPQVRTARRTSEWWDCRVSADAADFREVLSGSLDGQEAFFAGRLRVEGDVGIALRLLHSVKKTG